MGARWHKVRADLLVNKGRSLMAIMSLGVGTMAVGAMHLAGDTVDSSFEASFLAANPPSAMLGTEPFPVALVDDVVAHPAVGEAEGRRLLQARAIGANGDAVNIELVAMVDFRENHVARIEPATGGPWPPGAGAMVVERSSLDELGVDVGDIVTINVPGRGPIHLPVAGTAYDVYEVTPKLGGPARAYVSMDTMTELTGSGLLDTLYIRAAEDPLDREQALAMTAAVRDEVLGPADVAIQLSAIQEPAEHRGANALSFLVSAMQLLSLLALVIAVTLVVNTVTALLAQQRRHVGMMKAIGASSAQLTMQYLGYVLLLSLGALVVALPLSLLSGRFLAGFLADLANFDLEPIGIPWTTVAIEAAIVVVLPVLAVLVAVRRACRSTVREAMCDRGITAAGQRSRVAFPFTRPTVLAYRNAVRNRPRLALTVLTIALCGAVLVGVLSTGRALGRLSDQVAGYWAYDIELALTEPVDVEGAAAVLDDDEAVTSVEGWLETQAFRIRPDGTENENISLTGSPPGSPSLAPTLLEGRWFDAADDHPIVINTHFADEEPDLAVGDDVVLDIEGHRRPWNIVGVSTTTLVGPVAFVPVGDLADEIGKPGQANLLAVQLRPGTDPTATADRLESAAGDAGIPVGEVQTNAQLRAFVDDLIALVVGLLLVVGVVLAIVAVVGVAGTMTLSVVEQTREIGVLRTLGASSWAVRRLLLLQGLAVAATGCVLGVILSIPVAMLLRTAIGNSLISTSLPGAFSWFGVGLWALVAVTIGALGATRPARVAARLTIRDTLAYE